MMTALNREQEQVMVEWKVITPTGETTVNAWQPVTTATGDLVLKDNQGEPVHVFACGAWRECVLVKPAQRGYGG